MYILTIYRIIDDIDVEKQYASTSEKKLQKVAIAWAKDLGWEPEDEEMTISEQFERLMGWIQDAAGGDDPRVLLRAADSIG